MSTLHFSCQEPLLPPPPPPVTIECFLHLKRWSSQLFAGRTQNCRAMTSCPRKVVARECPEVLHPGSWRRSTGCFSVSAEEVQRGSRRLCWCWPTSQMLPPTPTDTPVVTKLFKYKGLLNTKRVRREACQEKMFHFKGHIPLSFFILPFRTNLHKMSD